MTRDPEVTKAVKDTHDTVLEVEKLVAGLTAHEKTLRAFIDIYKEGADNDEHRRNREDQEDGT